MSASAKPPHTPTSASVRALLWIDCAGGLAVGAALFGFAAWLAPLFRLPDPLYHVIAAANVGYGIFSLSLALRRRRPVALIATLAVANALWGGVCLIAAASLLGRASIFGLAHILAEGAVVFCLAQMEWRHRASIAAGGPPP
jgi:hypothetical protein